AAALLNDPTCGNGNQATMFANCYADTVHPNNTGHLVMSATAIASTPIAKITGVTAWSSRQSLKQYLPTVTNGPAGFLDVNAFDYLGVGLWSPGVLFNKSQGQMSWIAFEQNTGLTFHTPNGAVMSWCHTGGNGTQSPDPPTNAQCDLAYSGNRAFQFFQGSTASTGMTIQSGLLQTGTGFNLNLKGTMQINSNTAGVYSTTNATITTNNNSPCFNFV